MKPLNLKMRVCHFPQVPCKPFIVECNNEYEAYLLSNALADQHLFLFENDIIPDYSSAIVVEMQNPETDEWESYYNDAEFMEWEEFVEAYLIDCGNYTDFFKLIVAD